jgi:hypothetical protein
VDEASSTQDRSSEGSCITEAARLLVVNSGAAERLLALHRPSGDGRCVGCGHTMTRWPCALVAVARAAQDLVARRSVPLPNASVRRDGP